jgi:hypothetical protein
LCRPKLSIAESNISLALVYDMWPVLRGWVDYGVQHHFQQYFSYIVAVSFEKGGELIFQNMGP